MLLLGAGQVDRVKDNRWHYSFHMPRSMGIFALNLCAEYISNPVL